MSTDYCSDARLSEKDVLQKLERLERAVYVPIVAGEAAGWLEAVLKAAKDVEATTCEYYRTVHPEIYRQIAELDPEQNPRVQKLDDEDEEICATLHDVVELAGKLRGAGESVEPDERLLSNATKELSNRVVASVQRVRRHETEVSTWHVEALVRDRGTVD